MRQRVVVGGAREAEELDEAAPAAALAAQRRRRRSALLDPAGLDGHLLAERTHVDELGAFRRREAHSALAHEQRPLADGARPRRCDLRNPHPASSLASVAQVPPKRVVSLTCVFYM